VPTPKERQACTCLNRPRHIWRLARRHVLGELSANFRRGARASSLALASPGSPCFVSVADIDGVEIRAKYVGSIEVPEPRGDVMLTTAISRVRSQHKLSKENKPKVICAFLRTRLIACPFTRRVSYSKLIPFSRSSQMRFVISTTGIRVYDEATQLIRDTHPLERISYIMVLHANRKVFSFVTASDPRTSSERVFTAHVRAARSA